MDLAIILFISLFLGLPILIGIIVLIKFFIDGHKQYVKKGNQISFGRYLFMTTGNICFITNTLLTVLYAQSFLFAIFYLLTGVNYIFTQSHLTDGFFALISIIINWKLYKYYFQFKIGNIWVNPQSSFPKITDTNRFAAIVFVLFSILFYISSRLILLLV